MLSAQTPHSPKLRYGGEISHDGVQCFTWDFALVCLFRPPFLEVEIKNQQDWRIIYITIKIMRPCRRRLPTYKRRIKNEKNNFMLTGDSLLSSTIPTGKYKIIGRQVHCYDNSEYELKYVFDVKGDTLSFNALLSSKLPAFSEVKNGSLFK